MKFVINLVTPDNGEKFVVEMSNSTLTNIKGVQTKNPDLTITINRSDLETVMMGKATFDDLLAGGKAKIDGNRKPFDQLRGILVQFTPDFEMMPGTKPAKAGNAAGEGPLRTGRAGALRWRLMHDLRVPAKRLLAVSSDQRTDSLFIFVRDTGACDVFGYKPDLKLIHPENFADQQVVGSIVATRRRGPGRLAGRIDDDFVGLQQSEDLNGSVFTAPGRAGDARGLGHIVGHGDGHSAEGLNALGQRIHHLHLLAVMFVEEEVQLIEGGSRHLPVMFLVHIA